MVRIDWTFLRRSHLVVFLDPYFLGVNACISMSWRILTDKHTPCCRLPSHTWAARICSRRSRAQYPRKGEHQPKISEKYNKIWKLTLTRGLKPPSTSSILAQAWRKPGVNFKRNPCVPYLGFIHGTLLTTSQYHMYAITPVSDVGVLDPRTSQIGPLWQKKITNVDSDRWKYVYLVDYQAATEDTCPE